MDHDINQTPQGEPTFKPIPEETDSQEFNLPEELELPKVPHLEQLPNGYPEGGKGAMKSWLSRRHYSPSKGSTPREEKEAVGELLLILVDCMEELNTKSRESLLRKFFSEVERDERLESFIVERLRQSKVKAISDLCQQLPSSVREKVTHDTGGENSGSVLEEEPEASASNDGGPVPSYDADGTSQRSLIETVEDLSQELERFKVRTLEVAGIGQDNLEEGKK